MEKIQKQKSQKISKSRRILEYINIALDWISWIIIAVFVYIWWTQRGSPVGCERITADLCNSCFAYGRTATEKIILNISGLRG